MTNDERQKKLETLNVQNDGAKRFFTFKVPVQGYGAASDWMSLYCPDPQEVLEMRQQVYPKDLLDPNTEVRKAFMDKIAKDLNIKDDDSIHNIFGRRSKEYLTEAFKKIWKTGDYDIFINSVTNNDKLLAFFLDCFDYCNNQATITFA